MYYWFKYWVSMFGEFEEPHVDPWPMSGDIWGSSCNIQALGKHLDGGTDANGKTTTNDIDLSRSFQPLNDDLLCHFHPFSSIFIHFSSISSIWPFVPTTFVFVAPTSSAGLHDLWKFHPRHWDALPGLSRNDGFAKWKMAIESSLIYLWKMLMFHSCFFLGGGIFNGTLA